MKLGTLIKMLELYDSNAPVEFDFGYIQPTTLDSWRGVYAELALGYECSPSSRATVGSLLDECRQAVGATFFGWKRGDYTMGEHTKVWVDNRGEYSSTMLIGVAERFGVVILVTAKNLDE